MSKIVYENGHYTYDGKTSAQMHYEELENLMAYCAKLQSENEQLKSGIHKRHELIC